MRNRRLFVTAFALLALPAGQANAQDSGKTGVTMAYPASIGIIWHASDKVAIRPDFTVSGGTSETQSTTFTSKSHGWSFGTGVSALFYLHSYEHLRTYFAPRFSYSHVTNTSEATGFVTAPVTKTTGNSAGGAGSFGGQYALGDKFSVFGEVGLGFNHTTTKPSSPGSKNTSNTWGMRSGVGVIFYP